MKSRELETIDDQALDEVSGGCFGIGWLASVAFGGFMSGLGVGLTPTKTGIETRAGEGSGSYHRVE